jgi:hypothetical protein
LPSFSATYGVGVRAAGGGCLGLGAVTAPLGAGGGHDLTQQGVGGHGLVAVHVVAADHPDWVPGAVGFVYSGLKVKIGCNFLALFCCITKNKKIRIALIKFDV